MLMAHVSAYWPLFGLRVVTPRIELRYPDDELVAALAELAAEGIHDPATMPFSVPWTDAPTGGQQERNTMQFFWRTRAESTPEKWILPMAVMADGEPVGVQSIHTTGYAITRVIETGSWLGQAFQGQGIGIEMRAAILHLGFAGFGAECATTGGFEDNGASLGVTRRLGYEPNGEKVEVRRGEPARLLLFRMTRAMWQQRRRDDIEIEGLEPCLELYGLS